MYSATGSTPDCSGADVEIPQVCDEGDELPIKLRPKEGRSLERPIKMILEYEDLPAILRRVEISQRSQDVDAVITHKDGQPDATIKSAGC